MNDALLIAGLAVLGLVALTAWVRALRRAPIGPWVPTDIQFEVREQADLSPLRVKSRKTAGHEYLVELAAQRCSCTHFRKTHSRFATNDVRRLCRHLAQALRRRQAIVYRHAVTQAYLTSGPLGEVPPPPARFLEAQTAGGAPVYVGIGRRRWIEVFVRTREQRGGRLVSGAYRHYGFDRVERRWSRGDAPSGARELRALLAPLL